MHRFDYSFLVNMIPGSIVSSVELLSELKAREEAMKDRHREVFTGLENIAKIQSVKGSCAIEGIVTTDRRIEAIVNANSAPLNHNEQEIAGYRDALSLVHLNHAVLSVSEETVRQLHEAMLAYVPVPGGIYKDTDNAIIEIDNKGRRTMRFSPVPAAETSEAMQQLVFAYLDACSDVNISRLLLAPCFVLDFLCIHPFFDGNGRVSRLLSLLLLYKGGFDVGRYISFEQQINNSREAYYDALHESSVGWHENANNYFPFLQNFLGTLLSCYKELDKRLALLRSRKALKSERIEQAVLDSLLPISKKEVAHIVPDVSVTTIEAVLAKLVKAGAVAKVGAGPATKYIGR